MRTLPAPELPRILVVNPNTSPDVTQNIKGKAERVLAADAHVFVTTARFGPLYITSRASAAIAAHAVLDSVAHAIESLGPIDVIVIGCFGDPGAEALREVTTIPVVGFAEAGLKRAATLAESFVVVTSGPGWKAMLLELCDHLGLTHQVAGIEIVDPRRFRDRDVIPTWCKEVQNLARRSNASHVLVGGTSLIPLIERLTGQFPLPLVDAHEAAFLDALRLTTVARTQRPDATMHPTTYSGLPIQLTRFLTSGQPTATQSDGARSSHDVAASEAPDLHHSRTAR